MLRTYALRCIGSLVVVVLLLAATTPCPSPSETAGAHADPMSLHRMADPHEHHQPEAARDIASHEHHGTQRHSDRDLAWESPCPCGCNGANTTATGPGTTRLAAFVPSDAPTIASFLAPRTFASAMDVPGPTPEVAPDPVPI